MQDIEKLIEKFWNGTASHEEKERLAEYFNGTDTEYKEFRLKEFREKLEKPHSLLTDEKAASILAELHRQIIFEPEKKTAKLVKVKWNFKWVAAAAIFLAIAGVVSYYLLLPKSTPTIAIRQQPAQQDDWKEVVNDQQVIKIEKLIDGSVVKMEPGSRICFKASYGSAARNIELEGKASFDVAKDPAKPFTVHAKGFATTALGTVFVVDASRQNRLSVRLLEGKVRIKDINRQADSMIYTYLVAGEEFMADTRTNHPVVSRFVIKPGSTDQRLVKTDVEEQNDTSSLVFKKTLLADVFERLSAHFGVTIQFEKRKTGKQSFTGSFNQRDSLQQILEVICNLNELTYKEEGARIIIK